MKSFIHFDVNNYTIFPTLHEHNLATTLKFSFYVILLKISQIFLNCRYLPIPLSFKNITL
jgi:hypothetical protein